MAQGGVSAESISKAIEALILAERERIVKAAVVEFEAAVRDRIGTAALSLATAYSVERLGPELLIRVKIDS